MFVFGHLGIGSKLATPWAMGLRRRWILLGTILPDLIDKPVYYGLSYARGLRGAALGLMSGTRTFGHTGALLLLMATFSILKKSRFLAALSLGMATHLLLDGITEHFLTNGVDASAFDPN